MLNLSSPVVFMFLHDKKVMGEITSKVGVRKNETQFIQ